MRKVCPQCGVAFKTPRRATIFCGQECYTAFKVGKQRPEVSRKLNEQIEMIPIAGCWIWMGATLKGGYGSREYNGRHRLVHRVAYCEHHQIDINSIDGLVVRHRCDNPPCVNPNHLEIGTQIDNCLDTQKRDRVPFGEKSGGAKLTSEQVAEIRASYVRGDGPRLAKKYGVSPHHITTIVGNKTRLRG